MAFRTALLPLLVWQTRAFLQQREQQAKAAADAEPVGEQSSPAPAVVRRGPGRPRKHPLPVE